MGQHGEEGGDTEDSPASGASLAFTPRGTQGEGRGECGATAGSPCWWRNDIVRCIDQAAFPSAGRLALTYCTVTLISPASRSK